jgi:hypothetical protein
LFWEKKSEPIKRRRKWDNVSFCIWYWETKLDCGNAIPKTGNKDHFRPYKLFFQGINYYSSKFDSIDDFKNRIGANSDSYTRKYDKREPSVLRRIRISAIGHWVTINYIKWYVLNVILPEFHSLQSGHLSKGFYNKHNKFFERAKRFYDLNHHDCFALVGIPWNITSKTIAPLLIALHLETGWNLQPVLDLKDNCLLPSQDLSKPDDYVLRSYKNRSESPITRNIPSGSTVINIIKILTNIKERIKMIYPGTPIKNPDQLVMVRSPSAYAQPNRQTTSKSYTSFGERHEFGFPVYTKWMRNTHLMGLFIKSNGNLFAVKQAAGHKHFETTLGYTRNLIGQKEFKENIGNEVSVMAESFEKILTIEDRVQALTENTGCTEDEAAKMLQTREYPMMFFKCADPFKPPNDETSTICHNFHSIYRCLGCKSLVFVEEDLYDFYSLVQWRSNGHDTKTNSGETFDPIFKPLIESVEEKLEAKFPKDTLDRYKQLAQDKPLHGRKN